MSRLVFELRSRGRVMELGWPFGVRPKRVREGTAWKTGWLMEAEVNADLHV
ncbi:MAG: hypothetical protein IMZ50_10370 [Candidatus Atribacteria bacterium]|nr:hypothetical protein [Candidatus Atribacteria bacterium]